MQRKLWWRRTLILGLGITAGYLGAANEASAQTAPTERIVARVDVGWRPASRTFAGTRVFPAFSEQGNFEADYEIKDGGVLDGGLSFLLWRSLGVGLDISSFRSIHPAQISSELPHPFFYDLPRTTTGTAGGLERQELGIHIRALWAMQFTDWLTVSVSGGPSLINARQDLVSSVQHTEKGFPFDEIVYDGHTVSGQSETTLGLNGGIDIDGYVLHKIPFLSQYETLEQVGVGLLLRYVRGSVGLQVGDDPIEVDLGGLQITTGLRFRF